MAADELDELTDDVVENGDTPVDETEEAGEDQPLDLEVEVTSPSACERHVTVTVSREDIDRYLNDAFNELMPTSDVPGFRKGRAPRKLVENRYKKEVCEQIKGTLLMDSLTQVSEDENFSAISEPDLDLDAVEVPDEGPMTFEFDIEVRPDFDMPEWKGMKLSRPVREFTDEDVDRELEKMLARFGQLVPHDGPASEGDYLSATITGRYEGKQVSHMDDHLLRIRPTLSFSDGQLEGFDKLAEGAKEGSTLTAQVELTQDAPNEELRGKKVDLELKVLEVKKLKLPEMNEDFLQEMGGFESEEKMREAVKANLERQLQYQQQQKARQQITEQLTKSADWELPPGLLKRQSARELERAVMELRRSGFSEAEIRAHENQLKQNSAESTARALKEHFILERIADDEDIEAGEGDFEQEIVLMSLQTGESPRRVRAQIEKRGLMDVLQNQIIERKVLERVQAEAKFADETFEPTESGVEAIYMAAGGGEAEATIHDATEDERAEEAEASEE